MERFIVTKTTWEELEKLGYASVTDYCRYLVEKYPNDIPNRIEVYRGEMLCFQVNDVRIMATLQPTSQGFKKYTPRRRSKGRGCVKNESTGEYDI